MYIEVIKELQNTKTKKYRKNKQTIDEKLKRGIHQILYSSSYKQASRQANK